jgi:hypothetical protein
VRASEHHFENISQHVDGTIASEIDYVKLNIEWKIFRSRMTEVLEIEWSALQ